MNKNVMRIGLALAGTVAAVAVNTGSAWAAEGSHLASTGPCHITQTIYLSGGHDYQKYYLSVSGGNGTGYCAGYIETVHSGVTSYQLGHSISSGSYTSGSVYDGPGYNERVCTEYHYGTSSVTTACGVWN